MNEGNYIKEEPAKSKGYGAFFLVAALVLLLAAGGLFAYRQISARRAMEEKAREALSEETVTITSSNILGSYTVRIESTEGSSTLAGYIDSDALGSIVLHILSEYEPRLLPLEIEDDGTVSNEEMGVGIMTYKKSVDRTTIVFRKGETTCTLVK